MPPGVLRGLLGDLRYDGEVERADRLTILVAAGALAGSISIGTCSTSREIDRLAGAVETLRTDVRADFADVRADFADVRADIAEVRASVRRLDDRLRSVEIAIVGTASPQGE